MSRYPGVLADLDLERHPSHAESREFALAGLLAGTRWETPDGGTREISHVEVQTNRDGGKCTYPEVHFRDGYRYRVDGLLTRIRTGDFTPAGPAAGHLNDAIQGDRADDESAADAEESGREVATGPGRAGTRDLECGSCGFTDRASHFDQSGGADVCPACGSQNVSEAD